MLKRLFARIRYVPEDTPSDWWEQGTQDALACNPPKYGGDDWGDEYCQAYIQGYHTGCKAIGGRCDKGTDDRICYA